MFGFALILRHRPGDDEVVAAGLVVGFAAVELAAGEPPGAGLPAGAGRKPLRLLGLLIMFCAK